MPSVVLGLPMYGSEEFVADVIESLLALDHDDFAVVAVDDCSPDSTLDIARSYAATDSRLVVEANPERLGMIGNWNRALDRALELFPDLEFFAWASDNDLREPSWISVLLGELQNDPQAVLAYSRFGTIVNGEKVVPKRSKWLFETRGVADPRRRFKAAMEGMRAGPIMYGLHRRGTLLEAGNVPDVLLSDFIFLSHLSLYGTFLQAPDVLWYRDVRRTTGSATRKQRAALFAGEPPRLTYLPVSLQHTLWLLRRLVVAERRPAGMGRGAALFVSFFYLANWWMRLLRRGRSIARKRRLKLEKRLRKRLAPHKGLVLRYGLGRRLARAVRGPGRRS
jgi:glycosyltransferase involved in cell wall biosynthesis